MKLRFHQSAVEETTAAVAWYHARSPKAADGFVRELNTLLAQIARSPAIFALSESGYRRAVLPRYPFSVVFAEKADQIYVLAVAHSKRRPGYWRDREPH